MMESPENEAENEDQEEEEEKVTDEQSTEEEDEDEGEAAQEGFDASHGAFNTGPLAPNSVITEPVTSGGDAGNSTPGPEEDD